MILSNKHLRIGILFIILCLAVGTANARNIKYTRTDSAVTTFDIAKDQMVGHAIPYIYDIKVDNKQLVRGTAVGNYKEVEKLMRFAVNDAVNKLDKPADILTRAEYEYQQRDTILTVNVIGYPGYYVNYRPITDMNNDGIFDSSNYWRICDYPNEIQIIGNDGKPIMVQNPEHKHTKECFMTRFDYLLAEYGNPHGRRINRFGLDADTAKYFTLGYNANFPYSYVGISAGFGFSIRKFYINADAEFGYGGHVLNEGDDYYLDNEYYRTTKHDFTFGASIAAYFSVFETNNFGLLLGGRVGYTGLSSNINHEGRERYIDDFKEKHKGFGIGGPSVRIDLQINENLSFSPSYSVMFGKDTMQRLFVGFSRRI